jgi:hypothetical protein
MGEQEVLAVELVLTIIHHVKPHQVKSELEMKDLMIRQKVFQEVIMVVEEQV